MAGGGGGGGFGAGGAGGGGGVGPLCGIGFVPGFWCQLAAALLTSDGTTSYSQQSFGRE
jgi:hypothetical protein